MLEEWFTTGAADGFMLIVHLQPAGLEDFIKYVVPELQRRELFRTEYTGTTLRDHLGLARPPNRHVTPSPVSPREPPSPAMREGGLQAGLPNSPSPAVREREGPVATATGG